jgi:K+/H+ antiporter YhaU regulatory subunit KhtT
MSSDQSFSFANATQTSSGATEWVFNPATGHEDLLTSFSRENDVISKLDLILNKMAFIESRMNNLENIVQQGVQKYYDEKHGSHIVSSLVHGNIHTTAFF